MVSAGNATALIKVLEQGPDDAKHHAAYDWGEISKHDEHVHAVVTALVKVLEQGPDDAKHHAAWALGIISNLDKHVDAVVRAGNATALIKVLE